MSTQFNAIRGTLTAGGAGNVTLSSSAAGKGQSPSQIPVGWSGGIRFDDPDGVKWSLEKCTMLTGLVLQRDTVVAGSSGAGVKVNFSVGTTVLQAALADDFAVPSDVAFSTAIPLTNTAGAYMAGQTVSAPLTFTAAAGAVRGAMAYLRLVADGTNAPNYSAFKEWGGSLGYDNRNGIENQFQFFFDGFNYFLSISQAVGATPVPASASAVTLTGPTSGIVNQASSSFAVGVTPVGGAITGTVIVTPSDGGAGGAFNPTSISLSNGTVSGSFTYTPASTGAKSISVTNNGSLTNPAAITYTVAASATVPGAPTIGTAVAGSGYIDVYFTAPSSNGGAAIIDYTATLSTGQTATGTSSPIRVTAVNGTPATATVKARNSVGSSAASAASNSVTPIATLNTRLNPTTLTSTTESGTGPYSYMGTGGTFSSVVGGTTTTGLRGGADGSLMFTLGNYSPTGSGHEMMLSILNSSFGPVPYQQIPYGFYTQGSSGKYVPITSGTLGAASGVAVANTDVMRLRRSGNTTLIAEVSKDGGASWLNVFTWTGINAIDYNFFVSPTADAQAINLAGVNLS